MNEIHHHIFYQYVTPDGVIGGSNHLCKIFQTMDFPINYKLRIMNYKGVHKGSPLRSISNSSDGFPNNYELRIMNYEL